MTNRTKACAILPKVKKAVEERDSIDGWACCVYCGHTEARGEAHYVPRSRGGLGIEENLLTLCRPCHDKYDKTSAREEMRAFFKVYLKSKYPNWNEDKLIYRR